MVLDMLPMCNSCPFVRKLSQFETLGPWLLAIPYIQYKYFVYCYYKTVWYDDACLKYCIVSIAKICNFKYRS